MSSIILYVCLYLHWGLFKAVNKLFLNERLWKCIFNSRIAFNYWVTDYECNMTLTVCNSFYKKFNLQKKVVTEILSENMKAKDSIWIFLYNWRVKPVYQQMTLIPLVRHCRNHQSMACQVPIANTDFYKCSFSPQTIRDWNALPDSLISSAEGAEDGSVVRARD